MPGSPEKNELLKTLQRMSQEVEEVPLIIGNEQIKSDIVKYQPMVAKIVFIFIANYLLIK